MKKSTKAKQQRAALKQKRRQRRHEAVIVDHEKLMGWPNVEEVSLGWKERNGKVTSRFCVKIYVKKKKAKLEIGERLPKTTKVLVPIGEGLYESRRIPTDVVWHAPIKFCNGVSSFLNPIVGGALLGVPGGEVGSFACMVKTADGHQLALTAGHVIQQVPGDIPKGSQVVQPPSEPQDLPSGESIILGKTYSGFFGNKPDGYLDFALIELRDGRMGVSAALDGLASTGQLLTWDTVVSNRIHVTKFGAATRRTSAIFSRPVTSTIIEGQRVTMVYEFKGLQEELFGTRGDSGALVLSTEPGSRGAVVGLLFATSEPTDDAPAGRGFVFPFERMKGLTLV